METSQNFNKTQTTRPLCQYEKDFPEGLTIFPAHLTDKG